MNNYKSIILLLASLLAAQFLSGQTASVTSGCAELKVDFTAPQATTYFWTFGDGSISDKQNPVHSYVQSGDFVVKLFDQENGTQVGSDINITVYPPIEFEITASERSGCAPLEVDFTSTLNIHPDIVVKDIVWTFGDGESASGQNASYTYRKDGLYTVSLKVITENDIKCDEPVIFENYILIEGAKTTFRIDRTSACDTPADFIFTNTTRDKENFTFEWDFGNGETSTENGPIKITYDQEGLIPITLTSTSDAGCVTSSTRYINVGSPIVNVSFPDTTCQGTIQRLANTTIADEFLWDFSGSDIEQRLSQTDLEQKNQLVSFSTPGIQNFSVTAISEDGCQTTEELSIFIDKPDSDYELGPDITCNKRVEIEFEAENPNHSMYEFSSNIADASATVMSMTPKGTTIYTHQDRDEFYINYKDSVLTRMVVHSGQGCTDTTSKYFYLQRPEAFFIPDVVKGCVPFDVTFEDLSFSEISDISTRTWNFGDGSVESFGKDDTTIVHTFQRPGFHRVQLEIANEAGCTDLSREVLIVAIRKDTIPSNGRCNRQPGTVDICVGDTVQIGVTTDQIDVNIHLEGDDGRLDHCWNNQSSAHTFNNPGFYPIDFTLEFFDIYIDSFQTNFNVNVLGAKSDLDYTIDCGNPFLVTLNSEKSINADQVKWFVEDKLVSEERSLEYTFDKTGDYMIYLESVDDDSGCVHQDSALVHITDIKAGINMPDKLCANSFSLLDASFSLDVHSSCVSGYRWDFKDNRPREVSTDSLYHVFDPGPHTIQLTVEDINGCTDTAEASFTAYEVRPDFVSDTLICLPSDIQMTDLSDGDTTLVSWEWQLGIGNSSDRNPIYRFSVDDYEEGYGDDTLHLNLIVTDALGCVDSLERFITTYDIESEVTMENGPVICQDEAITFLAADYIDGGSFLTYSWEFQDLGIVEGQNPSIEFPNDGDIGVQLTFTEDATGCQGVIDTFVTVKPTPVAQFTTPFDDDEYICFPEQIEFTNTSIIDDDILFRWDFGNGSESTLEQPLIPFDKGTYEVEMIVRSYFGCSDTISNSYTLVGPEGEFVLDKDEICPGEPITLTLINPVDVSSYTWDFGDGNQVNDQSPVTHTYTTASSVSMFNPTLILRSDENGCEHIQDLPITLSSITADFIDSTGICPGEVTLFSEFIEPQSIEWIIEGVNESIVGTSNPSVVINSDADSINVQLKIRDKFGCIIERSKNIANPGAEDESFKYPNVFSPNGDNINQYFNIVYDQAEIPGEVEVVNFKIYNRWGELMYDNYNPSVGWDGAYKGEIVPPNVYAYFIEVAIEGCSNRSRKGNVTVVK